VLVAHGHARSAVAFEVLVAAMNGASPPAALHAARMLQGLGPAARPALPAMRARLDAARERASTQDAELFIQFALEAAVDSLEPRAVPTPGAPRRTVGG